MTKTQTVPGSGAIEPLDPDLVRRDFPILGREVYGRPVVYLDNAATTQKPEPVIDAIAGFYRRHNANVHRGIHALSAESTELYEQARREIAGFVGAADPREIVFCRGTSEAINLVAATWGRANLCEDDAVLLTEMEHHSNLVPWQLLAKQTGVELRHIPLADDGRLDLDSLDHLLDERVKLVSVVHVSNALGTVNPVERLVAAAKSVGALVLVDGAQSVPQRTVNVQQLGADFLAFSGHKMCGPTGIGCLWGKLEILEAMPPYQGGGEMITSVTLTESTYAPAPGKFEAGTPAFAQAVGLMAAVRYLTSLGMDRIRMHEEALAEYALQGLRAVPGVTVYGPESERGGLATFTMEGIHAHDLASILDRRGVAIRAGHHCAMPAHRRLGLSASARASFYIYNTRAEIDELTSALHYAREVFRLDA